MIQVSVGDEIREVCFIEYRPTQGLVVRVEGAWKVSDLAQFRGGLSQCLRDSPFVVFRGCCDTDPEPHTLHADDCPNRKVK